MKEKIWEIIEWTAWGIFVFIALYVMIKLGIVCWSGF